MMESTTGTQAFEWIARLVSKFTLDTASRKTGTIENIRWSAPAGFRFMRPKTVEEPIVGAVVRLLDGQRIHGRLEQFNPAGVALKLRQQINGQMLDLRHAQIKRLTLKEPVSMIEASDSKSAEMAVRAVADFQVQYVDGSIWDGETKGSISTPSGVFLYTMEGEHPKYVGTSRQNVARHFVPRSSIRSVRIGAPTVAGSTRIVPVSSAPIDYKPVASAPCMLEPETTEALEIMCKGQFTKIEGLKLGDALMQLGIVTREEVLSAVALQASRKDGRRIGAILMEMKQFKEETIQQALLHRLGVPFVKLGKLRVNNSTVARIDRGECLSKACAVLHENSNTVYLAMANPLDEEYIKSCRFRLQKKIEVVMADRADLAAFILRHRVAASQGLGLTPDFFFA